MQTIEQETIARLERLLLLDNESSAVATAARAQVVKPQLPKRLSALMIFGLGVATAGLVAYSVPLFGTQNSGSDSPVPLLGARPTIPEFLGSFAGSNSSMPMIDTIHAVKTTITGVVDADTMTAAYYLSMFIHNTGTANQEAQMVIKLPEGATVSRATLWINGVPQEAAFNTTATVEQAYDWVANGRKADPLLVKQLNSNTILVKASPVVPGRAGMKLRIGITAPLQPGQRAGEVLGTLPQITRRNFGDGTVDLHLDSARTAYPVARYSAKSLDTPVRPFTLQRLSRTDEFAARATHSANGGYVVARINRDAAIPYLSVEKTLNKPDVPIVSSPDAAARLSTLWAYNEIERQAQLGHIDRAVELARVYRVVSSVSAATVLEQDSDYDTELTRDQWESTSYEATGPQTQPSTIGSAPILQGATNGTIGPQGMDAAVITGVNTAGTARVNNLASIESGLNNLAALSGPVGSSAMNWMTSSSRDANLFDGGVGLEGAVFLLPLALVPLAPFLALIALNFAPSVVLFARGLKRALRKQPGGAQLIGLAAAWLALAIALPLASQILAVAAAVTLFRRRRLRGQAKPSAT